MFCTNCGQALVDGARFCNQCGGAVQPLPDPGLTSVATLVPADFEHPSMQQMN